MSTGKSLSWVVGVALLVGATQPVGAQGWLERAKNAAKEAAARKAEKGATDATNDAVDAATGKIKCAVNDSKCIDKAKAAGKGTILVGADGKPVADAQAGSSAGTAPVADAGSDFTPGTRVIFADDFTRDEIGNFPRGLNLKSGNMEVAQVGGARYLRSTTFDGEFEIILPEVLPARFTLEFDATGSETNFQHIYFTDKNDVNRIDFRPQDAGIRGPNDYNVISATKINAGTGVFSFKVMADGPYVKVYLNGTRVANAPNAPLGRSNRIRFKTVGETGSPTLFGNFRVAAGGKDLYMALNESGHVATEGIFFATGSDQITPASAPAVKQIADMLAAHPDLRLSIEGHTDNIGDANSNMALSTKRAAAVRSYLVSTLGVSSSRLSSQGFGATRPVGDNATTDGRQQNRRVELVKKN